MVAVLRGMALLVAAHGRGSGAGRRSACRLGGRRRRRSRPRLAFPSKVRDCRWSGFSRRQLDLRIGGISRCGGRPRFQSAFPAGPADSRATRRRRSGCCRRRSQANRGCLVAQDAPASQARAVPVRRRPSVQKPRASLSAWGWARRGLRRRNCGLVRRALVPCSTRRRSGDRHWVWAPRQRRSNLSPRRACRDILCPHPRRDPSSCRSRTGWRTFCASR